MGYYPIFLELEGKTVLVVGGGSVAQRKIETLLEYGAVINIISNDLTHKLKVLVESNKIRFLGNEFTEKDLDGTFLVIAATDDKQLNHDISKSARKRALLTNVVDEPLECNFIVPSIVRIGDLLIAISTAGKSPALAQKIRRELETQFGPEYKIFLNLMGSLREEILPMGLSQAENSRIFHKIVDSDILKAIVSDDWEEVESILSRALPEDTALERCLKRVKSSKVL